MSKIVSDCGKRRTAATASAEVTPPVLSTQRGWVEYSYAGQDELVVRGIVTGTAYFLKPGAEVTISMEDWPALQRTELLQWS